MKKQPVKTKKGDEGKEFPGYPKYPAEEDIYNHAVKDPNIHPGEEEEFENDVRTAKWNEKGIDESYTGEDLDVPGSELDDENERIGEEDEENNYYSLGGDNHDD